jgi:hypothetical protein
VPLGGPLLNLSVAGDLPRQNLERHPPAQRDLLGLVNDAHAAPADLAEDLVVANLPRERIRSPGLRELVVALSQTLGLLYLDHRREDLADVVSELRVAIGVFPERGPLAPAEAIGEFLGQSIKQVILFRVRVRHHSKSFETSRHRG